MRDAVRLICKRASAWTCRFAPVGIVSVILMPLARRDEGLLTVYRLIGLWRRQRRDNQGNDGLGVQ